jgi:hypothetical protein
MIKDFDSPYDGRHEGAARLGQDRHFTGSVSQYHGGCGPLSRSGTLSRSGARQDQSLKCGHIERTRPTVARHQFPRVAGPPYSLTARRPAAVVAAPVVAPPGPVGRRAWPALAAGRVCPGPSHDRVPLGAAFPPGGVAGVPLGPRFPPGGVIVFRWGPASRQEASSCSVGAPLPARRRHRVPLGVLYDAKGTQ